MAHASSNARLAAPARSILRGELDNVGLPTLLTICEMERRSGMLIVQRGRQLGRLFVRDGRVVRARVEGPRRSGGGSGLEAVMHMLAWPDGQFELWRATVDGPDELDASTTYLLMEAARRADEARGLRADAAELTDAW